MTKQKTKQKSKKKNSKKLPWWQRHDPALDSEATRYDNPIPSRQFIIQFLEAEGPLGFHDIIDRFEVEDDDSIEAISFRLKAMLRDGQLLRDRQSGYAVVSHLDLIKGEVLAHKDGFGFLRRLDSEGDDLFLGPRSMRTLMHGDIVLAREAGEFRGKPEAKVVEVIEQKVMQLAGRLYIEAGNAYFIPDNPKMAMNEVLIPKGKRKGAKHGQIVEIEITERPTNNSMAVGHVLRVLGEHMAPGIETDIAIRNHQLPCEFPAEVMEQAQAYGTRVPAKAKKERVDLRELPLCTIDGEDARDFDDAVYAEKEGRGWRLWVAIADVSYYVEKDTPLDDEAHERGTSVYFPSRVIPMLPEELSNGLCSLNPNVDRLCMVCEMKVNTKGKVTKSKFYEAVMRSHARLTYTEVGAFLDGKRSPKAEKQADGLYALHDLYKAFRVARKARGSIELESKEVRFVFNDDKKIGAVVPFQRNDAHCLIEECMIAANVEAAKFVEKKKRPALYRVHAGPKPTKLEDLRSFLAEFGLKLTGGTNPTPQDFAKVSAKLEGRPERSMVETVLLRTLSQAVYQPDNDGHFGLGLDHYAHFTSPIRRYPDLLLHRAIKHAITYRSAKSFAYDDAAMDALGVHCSSTERRAEEASREVVAWLKAEFMQDKLGEEYSGTICGVTSFGIFVEIDDIRVEGLVHITSLGKDYYHYDHAGHRLKGERTGKTYRLGDRLDIVVSRVDLEERKIDFDLVGVEPAEEPTKLKGSQKKNRRRRAKKSSDDTKRTTAGTEKGKKASSKKGSRKKAATKDAKPAAKKARPAAQKKRTGKKTEN